MKWALAIIVAVVVAALAYQKTRGVKTAYVNGLPPYTNLPGREYIVERDCYVFKFKARNTDWPLIGAQETVPQLPGEFSPSNVGREFADVRILDAIHVGDHFRIASVRRDESQTDTRITFEILLQDEGSRKYPRLDAYWIMDHSPEKDGAPPKILTAYAVPLRRE